MPDITKGYTWVSGETVTPKKLNDALDNAVITNESVTQEKLSLPVQALLVPAGAVMPFARNSAPTGWLNCNGAAVSRTTYAALFSAIGTTWGAGDGSTTFNVPDLRGEFVRGWDNGRGVDSGRSFASAQADDLKSHNHSISPNPHGHTTINAKGSGGDLAGSNAFGNSGTSANQPYNLGFSSVPLALTSNTTLSIGSTGGTETRPRNIAMLYCIKI